MKIFKGKYQPEYKKFKILGGGDIFISNDVMFSTTIKPLKDQNDGQWGFSIHVRRPYYNINGDIHDFTWGILSKKDAVNLANHILEKLK